MDSVSTAEKHNTFLKTVSKGRRPPDKGYLIMAKVVIWIISIDVEIKVMKHDYSLMLNKHHMILMNVLTLVISNIKERTILRNKLVKIEMP